MRIIYNTPVILTFTILALAVVILDHVLNGQLVPLLFSAPGNDEMRSPFSVLGVVLHIFGHASINHFTGNFIIILLVGPLLEEKYGSRRMLFMILFTALVTGLMNVFFFSTELVGASAVGFMVLILASFANVKRGEIPVTFICAVVLYILQEVFMVNEADGIAHYAHLIGGICGAFFGLNFSSKNVA